MSVLEHNLVSIIVRMECHNAAMPASATGREEHNSRGAPQQFSNWGAHPRGGPDIMARGRGAIVNSVFTVKIQQMVLILVPTTEEGRLKM